MAKSKTLKITQVKSSIGARPEHKATLATLGLRKINQTVEREDSPTVRGMIHSINHLVRVEK